MTRKEYIAAILTYLGSPHVHSGRIKGVAIDCVGLVICAFQEFDVEVAEDVLNYTTWDSFESMFNGIRNNATPRKKRERQAGDILVFRSEKMFNHIGVLLDDKTFIHSSNIPPIIGVCLAELRDWEEHLHSVWVPNVYSD